MALCRDNPDDADAWLDLAGLVRGMGRLQESEHCARHVLSLQPDNCRALLEYGVSVYRQGRHEQAVSAYRRAIQACPEFVEAHYCLATAMLESGHADAAEVHYRRVLEYSPGHMGALNNLSAILTDQGRIEEALKFLDGALAQAPHEYHLLVNQARCYLHMGDAERAACILRGVVERHPGSRTAHSRLLLCLNYLDSPDPRQIFAEHIRWRELHVAARPCSVDRRVPFDAGGKIRIGYLSPDLRSHPVACFIEPVLAGHDRERFHVTAYADIPAMDDVSLRLKEKCDSWCQVAGMSDDQILDKVRSDGIDILVDLAGHTAHNRLPVFARRAALVQITYLGYPNTTGLEEMDYRITDDVADPPGDSDRYYAEKLIRLPTGFLCYQPPEGSPEIRGAGRSGGIVFGSFNNLAKMTERVVSVWARILREVDGSRLLIKSKATSDSLVARRLKKLFADQGIEEERLDIIAPIESTKGHLEAYNLVDVALDTFPYNGTTTTCEALWMGVPVVTLVGEVHASRVGASLLSRVGFSKGIASSEDEYVSIAKGLATATGSDVEARLLLREAMQNSPVCKTDLFVRYLEDAYRKAWMASYGGRSGAGGA